MLKTNVESLWLLALASKCESLTLVNTIALGFLFLLSCLILHLFFWAQPGGSAWGRHKFTKPKSSSNSPPIPGPKGLPIIGSLDLMSGLAHHKIAAAAQSCQAQRLMAFSLGQTRAVVTCNPDVAREVLNSSSFSDRPAKESAYALMFNRSIGFAPYGVYWAALRKIAAAHLFCPKQIKASEGQRVEIANQVVEVLSSASGDRAAGIRVRDVLKLASLNNMMCSVFGRKYDVGSANPETEELGDLVDQGYDLLGRLNWSDHLSFLADFDLQKIRSRCGRIVPRVNRFVGRIIAEHKAAGKLGGGDFVDVLLSLQGADRLSDSDMIAVLWEMIFRGTDTVAVVIEWILARLVLHPDVQSKVHDELDKVVGRARAVTESDLTDLVYLTAVVKEVFRMHPPGPLLSWARLAIRDSIVDGHHVPAGTTAMVNMWAIMRDPNVWDDPLTFNPDRFLGQSPNTEFSILGSDLRIAPFGSGRRSCPGKTLGMSTVNFWVATLVHEFQFMTYAQGVDLSERLKLSCEMANPLVVTVRPRRP
ncbi:cytochrome p450 78a3 [Phtheirospermum japonicum]|uniref:Cytochrome p450 78a3 n=1 Tax=Phtheirospermum japonicum TaxID=374723 RepID=A0A830BXW9_9LAMI|nr:cytochrome p450 78a3 [Phtheirospermum japonicum]